MAGAYCNYCGHRCFVERVLPDGRSLHMATCEGGAAHDLAKTGYTYQTARNPHEEDQRMRDLTPYDTGKRLEPEPWVKGRLAGKENLRPAEDSDYGKVDFDNDEGTTEFTIWVELQQGEYVVHICSHSGEDPVVDFEEPS